MYYRLRSLQPGLFSAPEIFIPDAYDFTGKVPFRDTLQSRRTQFLDGLRHINNAVLHFMSSVR